MALRAAIHALAPTAMAHGIYSLVTKGILMVGLLFAQNMLPGTEYFQLIAIWSAFAIVRSTVGLPVGFHSIRGAGISFSDIRPLDYLYLAVLLGYLSITVIDIVGFERSLGLVALPLFAIVMTFAAFVYGRVITKSPGAIVVCSLVALLAFGALWAITSSAGASRFEWILYGLLVVLLAHLPILVLVDRRNPNERAQENESLVDPGARLQLIPAAIALTAVQISLQSAFWIVGEWHEPLAPDYAAGHQVRAIALFMLAVMNVVAVKWYARNSSDPGAVLVQAIVAYILFSIVGSLAAFVVLHFELMQIPDANQWVVYGVAATAGSVAPSVLVTMAIFGRGAYLVAMAHAAFSAVLFLLALLVPDTLENALLLFFVAGVPSVIAGVMLLARSERDIIQQRDATG